MSESSENIQIDEQQQLNWCLNKAREASEQDVQDIIYPISVEDITSVIENNPKIFLPRIQEDFKPVIYLITQVIGEASQKPQTIGETASILKNDKRFNDAQKKNFNTLIRFLYAAKLKEALN